MTAYIRETGLLTFRSLRAIPRVPERILDVTIQPIVFILLFRYVFGSAIGVHGISYADFLVPGIIGQGLAFGLIGTGTATSHDMAEGVLDRFRSMPVRRLSIVTGQVLGQYCEQLIGLTVYVALGLVVGWRPHFSVGTGLECLGLVLLAMFAFTWAGTYFGMLVRSPDAMQGVGFIIIFPLSFLAGVFVPIAGMDLIPRTIGNWDPISALVATVRKLSENYPSSGSWLLDHAELSMLLWSLLLLAIFVPLALRRFNHTLAS
ncbi:MAG TPA: ABC transporter permease [Solirubrobacteraceae bacterium]|jgi:ABC-type multidrug transport system permease subunit|nr:ABC transporter permease [Solirubrobacteraceae bacterium]